VEIQAVLRLVSGPRVGELDRVGHGLRLPPSVHFEIVRDAAEYVFPVLPEVAAAVTVRVDGIGTETRGNELTCAHRAGIGAERLVEIHALVAAEQQKGLELACEKAGAWRIRECERRERIEHAMVAHALTEERFDPDDRHDNLWSDAV